MSRLTSEWLDAVVAATVEPRALSLATVAELLNASIAAEQILYVELDFGHAEAVLCDELHDRPLGHAESLLTEQGMHPLTTSYLDDPTDRTPRRISDLMSQRAWEATPAYAEVFRPDRGRFQLSLVTSLDAPMVGRGWNLTRSLHDFSEHDLDLAIMLLPLAAVICNCILTGARESDATPELTVQEHAVLERLAQGWTAWRIGHDLLISERTVNKHLEHIYRKLGVGDRLMATRKAASLRLI